MKTDYSLEEVSENLGRDGVKICPDNGRKGKFLTGKGHMFILDVGRRRRSYPSEGTPAIRFQKLQILEQRRHYFNFEC